MGFIMASYASISLIAGTAGGSHGVEGPPCCHSAITYVEIPNVVWCRSVQPTAEERAGVFARSRRWFWRTLKLHAECVFTKGGNVLVGCQFPGRSRSTGVQHHKRLCPCILLHSASSPSYCDVNPQKLECGVHHYDDLAAVLASDCGHPEAQYLLDGAGAGCRRTETLPLKPAVVSMGRRDAAEETRSGRTVVGLPKRMMLSMRGGRTGCRFLNNYGGHLFWLPP
jgi:hypothetical protein